MLQNPLYIRANGDSHVAPRDVGLSKLSIMGFYAKHLLDYTRRWLIKPLDLLLFSRDHQVHRVCTLIHTLLSHLLSISKYISDYTLSINIYCISHSSPPPYDAEYYKIVWIFFHTVFTLYLRKKENYNKAYTINNIYNDSPFLQNIRTKNANCVYLRIWDSPVRKKNGVQLVEIISILYNESMCIDNSFYLHYSFIMNTCEIREIRFNWNLNNFIIIYEEKSRIDGRRQHPHSFCAHIMIQRIFFILIGIFQREKSWINN